MNLAPIILFIYNRLETTKQTLEALEKNVLADQSLLYIYADGAKENASSEQLKNIQEVREFVKTKKWCKEVIIIEQEKNLGLANSIITGVTEIVNKHEKVIVLEDDLITSPYFLQFMNDGLAVYENEEKVWSLGACNFFAHGDKIPDTFFIPIPDCLGWATWKSRWQYFEPNSNKLIKLLREQNLVDAFNIYGAYNFMDMLELQAEGIISSWAIRWQAMAYLKNAYALYPKYALTNHIGLGIDATHSSDVDFSYLITFPTKPITVKKQAIKVNKWVNLYMIEGYKVSSNAENLKNTTIKSIHDKVNYIAKEKRKEILKKFVPPIFLDLYRIIKSPANEVKEITEKQIPVVSWNGNYASWEEAKQATTGYEKSNILEKVKTAVLKVKHGEAVYERDSFLFDKMQYSWALLACLLKIGIENNNELRLIDFGGSLGSSYFQNRQFLSILQKITWSVVEQSHFVELGQNEIADENLKFYYNIEDCLLERKSNVILLSSVIQYLDKPYNWIEKLIAYQFDYIIIDRTAFIESKKDRLTVQEVHEPIYEASYPAWFFNEQNFLAKFEGKYEVINEFESFADGIAYSEDNKKMYRKGFLLKKIS